MSTATVMTPPKTSDLLAVHSRISWGAIAAGAMLALTIYSVLAMLGLALGIEVAVRRPGEDLAPATAIYSIVSLLVAMFFGGWATSRLAVGESKLESVLYGLILWGVLFAGMLWLLSVGVRTGFGAMVGATSGAYNLADDSAKADGSSAGLVDALSRRYDSEVGGANFVEDMKKAGFTDEQAKKAQSEVKSRFDRVRNDPSQLPAVAREVADKPEVREAAAKGAEGARKATWWTLAGMIISLGTVVWGSLVGSGEMLRFVPILGTNRAANRRDGFRS